jgi:hypothetical protein
MIRRDGGSAGVVSLVVTPTEIPGGAQAQDDFNSTAITVAFVPENMNRLVNIPVVADGLVEGDEPLRLDLSLSHGAPPGADLGAQTTATLTILDSTIILPAIRLSLLSPGGFGPQNFVASGRLLPYRINFENTTNATAPAQQVVVIDPLSPNLDWTTFELTEIALGDHLIAVPPNPQHFEKTEQLRVNGFDFQVQIEAGIRLATGEVYARFQSLDPSTGLPPPVDVGLLPPEDGTGRGQGHISYVIRSQPGLPTGTEIRNIATITFDGLETIRTDQVDPHDPAAGYDPDKQALVTIDADEPSSEVSALPETAGGTAFEVCWSGADLGAGIATYDLYVQADDGPWTLWLASTSQTCATFLGSPSRSYHFYSRARDGAGHLEAAPARADAVTQTPLSSALEADVAPRPGGNDAVTVSDWVQVGRFAAGLDDAEFGSEFMRAD